MPVPAAGSRDATPAPVLDASMAATYLSSRLEPFGSESPPGPNGATTNISSISSPPLKRLARAVPSSRAPSPLAPSERAERAERAPLTNASVDSAREMPRISGTVFNGSPPRRVTTPPLASVSPTRHLTRDRWLDMTATPKAQMAASTDWSVEGIASQLETYSREIREGHAQLVAYAIESTTATEKRVLKGRDLFARLKIDSVAEKKGKTMRIKFKQHIKTRKDHKVEHYNPVCIKTNKDAVPSYRFHHVEIKKNVLTPNTMLTFVPHLRDLESSEEATYNLWLKELEDIDLKSGFTPMNREDKHALVVQSERAATLSLYLDSWLDRLSIPHCSRSTLIRYVASQEPDDVMTPQQRTDIIRSHADGDSLAVEALRAAELFTSAFRLAFERDQSSLTTIDLRRVLLLDESVDNIMDNKSATKENSHQYLESIDEVVESSLATYCILGCLICFSHSCDHGEYDNKNLKRTFSLSSCSPLPNVLRRKRVRGSNEGGEVDMPCRRRCHELGASSKPDLQRREWSEDEHVVLRSLFITSDGSKLTMDPVCLAAEFLNRDCCDVYAKFLSLNLSRPRPEKKEAVKLRNVSWYDRRRKMLLGDWQDHIISHEHQRREILEPCFHDGPCAPKVCSCVDAGILCEKFCGCTVERCVYKFTGCACHSQGKACYAKQKDRPCICVQLNRECDPELCGSCGALERADPTNADDLELFSTGCQNCELQCGRHKELLLGRSQLEGVGYGLFTAEDIAQDEYIIEYVGELITHDEGVRREARRGDVFDEESNTSYVFTLLEHEGIWVDAAIYGNLSRYINHASEDDTRGCNITPRILYVNGEYRIKFTALRDIKAGEELFFNYGENFPNLTKKLLDHKAGEEPADGKSKPGRPRRAATGDRVARKAPKTEQRRATKPRRGRKQPIFETPMSEEEAAVVMGLIEEAKSRKRKRRLGDDDNLEDVKGEEPTGTDESSWEADSAEQSEQEEATLETRLRRRTRPHSTTQEPEVPSKASRARPKTRGKRGGARPGSGRPRKHPLPDSAPTTAALEVTIPKPSKIAGKPEVVDIFEIEDSEDEDFVLRYRETRVRRMPASFRADEAGTS